MLLSAILMPPHKFQWDQSNYGQRSQTISGSLAIEIVEPQAQVKFYLTYFDVPKKDGGYRLILDQRGLNKFLKVVVRKSDMHMLAGVTLCPNPPSIPSVCEPAYRVRSF